MSAAKPIAATLLILGLVLAGIGSFVPVGENWEQTGAARTTEEFTLFTQKEIRTDEGGTVRESPSRGWSDDRFDGEDGTTQMLASGIVMIVALLVAVVATILVFTPVRRLGGILGIFAAVGVATSVALAVVGMRMRTEEALGDAAALDPRVGVWLLGIAFVLVLLGSVIAASLRRVEGARTNTWEDYPARVEARNEAAARAEADHRTLRCPDCDTTTSAPEGVVPTCSSCGFHRRDQDPWQAGNRSGAPNAV